MRSCRCHACLAILDKTDTTIKPMPWPRAAMRMIVCAKCGNKRCPHANDHRNACTGSNATGQPGSAYA